ncbi:LysR substrate-binding domain-containing protein [Burkholderia cepacia]|uniref:LysR family transcriptional regulator n=1 Tax=Burkholderia cepacia GG4 TaxID=1009846 RepID=A0A9W3PC04_BURCE|nr:LysR substrate-binding domain-containing protein [Burkholderia cepacia]AFQ51070.1 LysR family transcriptional regulator [Burkholderia cepacia GG4]
MLLRTLRALIAFHRLGTVVAAAEEVHLSPAAVSAQFKLLEERLGIPLFVRTKRSLTLSSTGIRMLPIAAKMLSTYEELQQLSDTDALQGQISLGVINTVLIGIFPEVLERLKTKNPRLKIRIVIGTASSLVAQVEAGILDAAIVNNPPGALDPTLTVHHLYTDPVALVQSANHPKLTLDEAMRSASYIALDRNTWAGRMIDQFLLQNDLRVEPELELDSQVAILALVRHGLGVSVLPVIRGTTAADTSLRFTPLKGIQRFVVLVERGAHSYAHITAELIRTIQEVARLTDPRSRASVLAAGNPEKTAARKRRQTNLQRK